MHQHSPTRLRLLTLLLPLLGLLPAMAQNQKFTIESFGRDVTDLTASKGSTAARTDGNGDLYAIIKVTSNNPDDDLREYNFNFMSLNHIIDGIHDGELWIYVQKNAKSITITRDGYSPILRHDLGEALSPGKVYRMQLASTARPVMKQIVQFKVQPPDCQATVFVQSAAEGSTQKNLGVISADGELSDNLPYGQYSYTVTAKDYRNCEGTFILNDKSTVKVENVRLKPQFAIVTLTAPAGGEIVVNGDVMGRGSWTGRLSFGTYPVEVRLSNHRPSSTYLTIDKPEAQTIQLPAPMPIMGTIGVLSQPSGATVKIDGKDYGTTPCSIDVIIGEHTVELTKANHQPAKQQVTVRENDTETVNLTLSTIGRMTITSSPSDATLYIDGRQVGNTPYTAEMASGDYRLRLEKRKCNTVDKTVHLDISNPEIMITLPSQDLKRNGVYLQAAVGAGTMMNVNAALGAYIGDINIEAGAAFGLCKATLYKLDANGGDPVEGTLTPMAYMAKVGYAIAVGNRMRITPQVGVMAMTAKASGIIDISATSATVGVRFEYAVAPAVTLFAAPCGRFAVQKGDAYTYASDLESSIKGWGTGADLILGIAINF